MADGVGPVDLRSPIPGFDHLEGHRYRFLTVLQCAHHAMRDLFRQLSLLVFGLSRPQFDDDVGHGNLLPALRGLWLAAAYLFSVRGDRGLENPHKSTHACEYNS